MMKRALIIDLDNTIYPVKSIGEKLFAPLFNLIDQYRDDLSEQDYENAREDIMRKPFQKVAESYHFNEELTRKGVELLRNTAYNEPMQPFKDYQYLKELNTDKFLVTTGFVKLQTSKIQQLGIANDFGKIYIVDPDTTEKTKKDIFLEIINDYRYDKKEVLVVGDDPESEIKAGKALGMDTFLYDPGDQYPDSIATFKGKTFRQIKELLQH